MKGGKKMKSMILWLLNLVWVIVSGIIGYYGWFSWWFFFGGLIVFVPIILLFIYFGLAPRNYFFTFVKERTAKVVVKGDAFHKLLIQWNGYTIDGDKNVIPVDKWTKDGKVLEKREDELFKKVIKPVKRTIKINRRKRQITILKEEEKKIEQREAIRPRKEPWHFFGGLRFYGFWPFLDIYTYDFQWTGVKENGELDPHPKERLDFIILKDDIYWGRVEKAEDIELLPLELGLLLTIRVKNPYKALFNVQNWLEAVVNRLKPLVRDRITQDTYQRLIQQQGAIGEELYNTSLNIREEEFLGRYGIEIRKIEVKDINPGEDYRKATLLGWTAKRDRERIEVEADAEAKRLEAVYGQIKKFGDLGKLIRALEAMEKSPEQGAKWIIPIPGMAEFFSQVFPGKKVESLSSDELRTLKEIIEQFRGREPSPKQEG